MTNEEKAIELQKNDVCVIWNDGCPNVRESALKMAKWKDEQIKSNIEKAFNCMIFRQDHSLSNKEHQYIDLDIVQNIIESFFHIKLNEYGEQN